MINNVKEGKRRILISDLLEKAKGKPCKKLSEDDYYLLHTLKFGGLDDFERGYLVGALQRNDEIKDILDREYNDWYQFYLRKAQCPSEYSRDVAPSQMDAIDNLYKDIKTQL